MAVHPFNYEAALTACATGNEETFQELYRHEAPRMLALCTRMLGNPGDAQEIVRDAFVLIWKNADSFDPEVGSARAWMYSIMRYRILNRLRQSGRPSHANTEWAESIPKPLLSRGIPAPLVQRLAQLDDAQRRPILMAFYNGLTYEQIAAHLATPISELRRQVRAGLRAIQELEA
ncbi:MAG TPA: sigma-70 family RNA polymerase sigma factor [Eoetvoesiella sp.]